MTTDQQPLTLREKIYQIIFEADTPAGKRFDIALLVVIVISIALVMLESIPSVKQIYGKELLSAEWLITILFTVEYLLRIFSSPKPAKYIFSFLGIIDLLAIIPTFLSLLAPDAQALVVIRAIRLLRIYRILKLYHFIRASNLLVLALQRSARKILIFMMFIAILVVMLGSIMYVVEGAQNGFYSIPLSIYWAIITLTTVGYGDIVPLTDLGKFIASFIMLLGYSILAIPTGIVTVEMSRTFNESTDKHKTCNNCGEPHHTPEANYCRICGEKLSKV
ncbi:ion transporter [Geofilum rubicundum]|uniref:Potassium voltage-gated channel subfamily KQT n=1 Tax=Geofilum rubicundum JCM 15548 TaxID=1236989 RepID=A0A0E9LRU6_9BACT|nr:ion transporter [Geofilum rubicundum]GAO28008.1 potassium voltage-gated channel subfamily KQT [Geofilum rubicundum JCM 15548]